MRAWVIYDTEGRALHEGRAKTKRGFIADLVAAGASLAGANLSGLDLSGLDLRRADLSGADLSRTDLRGAQLQEAVLRRADMRECRAQGAKMERARCEQTRWDGADLSGARLTYATFRGATFRRSSLKGVAASSCVFSHANIEDTDFSGAWLINSDFGNSVLVSADFSGARLDHRALGGDENPMRDKFARHLPNRTRGAIVVGCAYDARTVLSRTVPAMHADRRVSRIAKAALWASSSLGVVAAGASAEEFLHGTFLSSHLGTGAGFVVVLGALYLAKEGVGEWAKDKISDCLRGVVRKVRETVNHVGRMGTRRFHIVCAMVRHGSPEPLLRALRAKAPDARRSGFWHAFQSFVSDLGHVVVCDRRHLAMALGALSANRNRTYHLPEDIVLVRADRDPKGSPAPCAVCFHRDGTSSAVWKLPGGGHATTRYGEAGGLEGCWSPDGSPADASGLGLPDASLRRLDAAHAMEAALLDDHDLSWFDYPRDTHYLQAGRDGAILVHRAVDRRIDNPSGSPAIVTAAESWIVRNGSVEGEYAAPAFA
jgi:hypothetical protein